MSKKQDRKNDYINLITNSELWEEIRTKDERVAAILGIAVLDVRLEKILRKFLIHETTGLKRKNELTEIDKLFSFVDQGPLATIVNRARFAYCVGVISKDELEDIKILAEIRNIFAHHLFDCTFEQEDIRKLIYQLKIFTTFVKSQKSWSSREHFNIAISVIDNLLDFRERNTQKREESKGFQNSASLTQ